MRSGKSLFKLAAGRASMKSNSFVRFRYVSTILAMLIASIFLAGIGATITTNATMMEGTSGGKDMMARDKMSDTSMMMAAGERHLVKGQI